MIYSRWILYKTRKFSNSYRKSKHTFNLLYPVSENCAVYEIMWKNFGRPTARQATDDNTRRRIRFVRWITKAADTHSEYVIFTVYPWQLWLGERNSVIPFIRTLHVLYGHWVAEWQIKKGGVIFKTIIWVAYREKKVQNRGIWIYNNRGQIFLRPPPPMCY
jgi:hypothetical protein